MPFWSALLRPELAEIKAYVPADSSNAVLRLDANEAPPHPSPAVRDVVARAVAGTALHRYPDARALELKSRIAERTGARPEELIVGAGSDEVISLLVTALCTARPGSSRAAVLAPSPTFVMYRVSARAHGLDAVDVPLDDDWDLDAPAMQRALAAARPNLVFIASPNNPTGTRMSDDRVASVLDAAHDAVVVLDEAYVDYAGDSLRGWRRRFPNLAILRTLSKVGLAALRVGWLEADEALVREIDKVRQPYNLSATSQAAAAAVLAEAWDEVQSHVAVIVRERERLAQVLRSLQGVTVAPSRANFLWVRTPRPAKQVYEALVARGVLVRSFHAAGGRLADRLRVTVGSSDENARFAAALAQVVQGG